MDIEELTKAQIILLVLLVSFVTSIATGIVTVSLLAQAPPAVTQTVNHIIQRTVEAVAPTTGAPITVKETTVVVKEDDLVSNSVGASFSKLGVVYTGTSTTSPIAALGVVINGGLVLTDSSSVDDGAHLVSFDATTTVYVLKSRYSEVGLAVLAPTVGVVPGGFRIADTDSLRLGTTLLALPSASGSRIGIGSLIARYTLARVGEDKDQVPVRALESNISGRVLLGAPLISVSGDLVGLATSISQGDAGSPSTFVSVSDLAPIFLGVRGTSTPPTP